VLVSREPELLDTGGGIARALAHLGTEPFFVVSAKQAWSDGREPALARLAAAWDDDAMDALLLLQPIEAAIGFDGPGDFFLDADRRIEPRGDREAAPFAYTSIQMLHPRLFQGAPAGPFSLWVVWRKAIAGARAFGLVHDGGWCAVSTQASLALADAWIGRNGA
jgi:MurNAc alpha-1-phosphate uridylyltransferase